MDDLQNSYLDVVSDTFTDRAHFIKDGYIKQIIAFYYTDSIYFNNKSIFCCLPLTNKYTQLLHTFSAWLDSKMRMDTRTQHLWLLQNEERSCPNDFVLLALVGHIPSEG